MAGSGGAPLLKVVSACKEFSGVRVLNNVSFELSAGEQTDYEECLACQ